MSVTAPPLSILIELPVPKGLVLLPSYILTLVSSMSKFKLILKLTDSGDVFGFFTYHKKISFCPVPDGCRGITTSPEFKTPTKALYEPLPVLNHTEFAQSFSGGLSFERKRKVVAGEATPESERQLPGGTSLQFPVLVQLKGELSPSI